MSPPPPVSETSPSIRLSVVFVVPASAAFFRRNHVGVPAVASLAVHEPDFAFEREAAAAKGVAGRGTGRITEPVGAVLALAGRVPFRSSRMSEATKGNPE